MNEIEGTTANDTEVDFPAAIDLIERGPHDVMRPVRRPVMTYIVVPAVFLLVALLGGLRLGATDNAFIFLKPPLVCLVFAAVMMVLFIRSGLIDLNGWFADEMPVLQNIANGAVLISLFCATTQLFNAVLPEKGLPFWVIGFCFLWTLWNNLFADFDTKRLLRSLGALFAMAFVVRYLVLANLTAPTGTGWLRGLFENPAQQAFTWLLDLPVYSAGTGYIQFFTLTLFLIGLFLTPQNTRK